MKKLEDIISRIKFLNEQISKEPKIDTTRLDRNPAVSTYVKIRKPLELPKKEGDETVLSYNTITDLTINHIEGGYYNPKLHYDKNMGSSGETMFGMDRKHGIDFTNSEKGKEFWSLIDSDRKKNSSKWKRYYELDDNPELKQKLIDIISSSWLPESYKKFSETYISDTETKNIIESDPRLKFHMSYACWNGMGFFRKFANQLTEKIKSGIKDVNQLFNSAMEKRTQMGGVIAKSADIIKTEIVPKIS